MNNPPKKHHLIPRFYLEAFAEKGKIEIHSLGKDKPFRSSITKAFTENNFYKFSNEETRDSLEFEQYLANKEGEASKSLRGLRNKQNLGLAGKEAISEFLLIQWTRGKDFRLASQSFKNLALRDMARQSEEKDIRLFHEVFTGELLPDEEWERVWRQYIREEGPGFSASVEDSFRELQRLSMPTKQSLLLMRRWVVLDFKEPMLISGDRPVVTVPLERSERFVTGPGLAKSEQIIFPLSRKKSLLLEKISDAEPDLDMGKIVHEVHWQDGNLETATEINRLIALNARERIFGHPLDSEILRKARQASYPIEQWTTGSNWGEATESISDLKEELVQLFSHIPRSELKRILDKKRPNSGDNLFFPPESKENPES